MWVFSRVAAANKRLRAKFTKVFQKSDKLAMQANINIHI